MSQSSRLAVETMAARMALENATFNMTAPPHKLRQVNVKKLRHRIRHEMKAAAETAMKQSAAA